MVPGRGAGAAGEGTKGCYLMATIKSQMVLEDGVSGILKKMTRALDITLASFEQVQQASGKAIDTQLIEEGRGLIVEVNRDFERMAEECQKAAQEEEKLNQGIRQGTSAMDGLLGKVTSVAAAYASLSTAKSFAVDALGAADVQIGAQVQLKTVMGNMGSLDYYDQVLDKAGAIQGKGIYGDEAMIAGAGELATYFSDGEAILSMMDTLSNYAMGMSGGGVLDTTAMVDYATGIGKIMTGSYDAMTKKGFEFSETQKAIIEGSANEAQIAAELGAEYLNMSADMQAAAVIGSVIDESWARLYETMSNTPEGKLIQMNNTLGDIKENVGAGIYPAVLNFVNMVQSNLPQIESAALNIATIISSGINLINLITQTVLPAASSVGDLKSSFDGLLPVIVAAAVVAGLLGVQMAASALMGAGAWALAHLPLIVFTALIVGLIGYAMQTGATFQQVCGTIGGVFGILFGTIYNTFVVPFWNAFAMVANFFANIFNDPIAAIEVAFLDLCLTVIGYIRSLANSIETLLNKIPGVTVDITSGLDGFYSQLEQAQQAVKDESGWVEVVSKLDYMDAGTAWDTGYNFGAGVADILDGLFDTSRLGSTDDYTGTGWDNFMLAGLGNDVGAIADNTGGMAQALEVSGEELKYLRDIAERDAINRFTTAEVKIDMTGMTNKIDGSMDLDGVIRELTDGFSEALVTAAEGVHE